MAKHSMDAWSDRVINRISSRIFAGLPERGELRVGDGLRTEAYVCGGLLLRCDNKLGVCIHGHVASIAHKTVLEFSAPLAIDSVGEMAPSLNRASFAFSPRQATEVEIAALKDVARTAVTKAATSIESFRDEAAIREERFHIVKECDFGEVEIGGERLRAWMDGTSDAVALCGVFDITTRNGERNTYLFETEWQFKDGGWMPRGIGAFDGTHPVHSEELIELAAQKHQKLMRDIPAALRRIHIPLMEREASIAERLKSLSQREYESYARSKNADLERLTERIAHSREQEPLGKQMTVGY